MAGGLAAIAFGDSALRIALPPGIDRRALLATLRAHPLVVDAVVSEGHALVTFDRSAPPPPLADLLDRAPRSAEREPPREHRVLVRYDGDDLEAVATAIGRHARDVIALHTGRPYVVSAVGFLPGFGYLRGLDPALVLPRRRSPRPRVPARSVAIAGAYSGVYPFASPGGWHLLGTAVDFVPFDSTNGSRLALGDRVAFVEAR